MNLRDLLVDLNKEFYGYKNDIFFTKFLKRTGSTCKVNKVGFNFPPPDLLFQIYYSSMANLSKIDACADVFPRCCQNHNWNAS